MKNSAACETKKNDSLIKQVFHLFSGAFITLVIGVLTTPILTRLVDPTEYGQHSLFVTYSTIALLVFSLGLDNAFVRYFYVKEEFSYKKGLLQYCFRLPMLLTGVGAGILILLYLFVPKPDWIDLYVLFFFIGNIFIMILNRFAMLVLRLQYKTGWFSAMTILSRALYVVMAIPAILLLKKHYLAILVFATVISVLLPTIACMLKEKTFWFSRSSDLKLPAPKNEILKYGFPLMIGNGVFSIFQAMDKLCVNHFGTEYDVGIYTSAQNLISAFAVIQTTFVTLWIPKAIEHYEKHPEDREYYRRMNQIMTVVMFSFGAIVLLCKDLIILLLGEKYRAAFAIFPFLMFNPIMYTLSETTGTGLSITKQTKCQVIITSVSAVANFIGNIILIPILGPKGAAVSTGISYIIFFTMRTLFANHYFPMNYKLVRFYILTVLFAGEVWYHMYHSFNWIIVVMFLATVLLIAALYWHAVKDIFVILKEQIVKNKRNEAK